MGTQAPKYMGLIFTVIGVPLILWDADRTKDELDALAVTDNRQEMCLEKTAHLAIPDHKRGDICRCMITEVDRRGIVYRKGDSLSKLKPLVEGCLLVHLNQ